MIIATFGPATEWAGKTIAREGDAFMLEGEGAITASDVMQYDGQGHLVWVNEGTRAWVASKANAPVGLKLASPQPQKCLQRPARRRLP